MKLPLIALLAVVLAAPVVTVPTPADAQVRVGSGARRDPPLRVRTTAPRLTEAEEDRLWDAQAAVSDLDSQIAAVNALVAAAGGATPEHQATLADLTARRTAEQEVVDNLRAKQNP